MKEKNKDVILKNIKIPEEVHVKIRLFVARSGTRIVDFVTEAIEKSLKESKSVKS